MATALVVLADAIGRLERDVVALEVTDAAAKVLADVMRQGTASAIGADLRMSGFRGGPPVFKEERSTGLAKLTIQGGTYALADAGRKTARARIYPKRRKPRRGRAPALMTPRGPRRSVRGSTWAGKRITDTYAPRALDDAVEAARKVILAKFAAAV